MIHLQNFPPQKLFSKIFLCFILILTNLQIFLGQNKALQTPGNLSSEKDFQLRITLPFKPCWSFTFEKTNSNYIASDNVSGLYNVSLDGEISKINSETGKIDWKADLGGEVISDALVFDKKILIATRSVSVKPFSDNAADRNADTGRSFSIIRSLDINTGITVWETKLLVSDKAYLFENMDDIIIIAREGAVYRIQKTDGQISWKENVYAALSTIPILDKDSLILGTEKNSIAVLPIDQGKSPYKIDVSSPPAAILGESGGFSTGKLFLGDRKGAVTSINTSIKNPGKKRKRNWVFRSGAEISHLIGTPKGLLISSFDNFIYLVSETNGDLIWKKRFPARVSFKPLIVGNYVIVITDASLDALILKLEDGSLINKISISADTSFNGSPVVLANKIIFPTLRGIYSFSAAQCSNQQESGL